MGRRILCSLLLWVALTPSARGETIILTPLKDNTLYEDASGSLSNGSGPEVFCGRILIAPGPVRRALLAFDVSSLPTDATIDSVSLELELTRSSDPEPRLIRVYRVLSDWGEGASSGTGQGAPAEAGDATWLHTFSPNSLWSKPGGDFASTASDSTTVLAPGPYVWKSQGLASDVHGWTSESIPNFGWILIGDETTVKTARGFDSSEGTTPPRLVIHYSVTTDVTTTTWGKLKLRYR